MVFIKEMYDTMTDAQRRPPLPFLLHLLSIVPLFQQLVADYVTNQEQARTLSLDYDQTNPRHERHLLDQLQGTFFGTQGPPTMCDDDATQDNQVPALCWQDS
uniref:Uncharacterized protein n=1 Tax=Plectus sambesii TaxID=2011161 RepID=A0A914WA59_9BILA